MLTYIRGSESYTHFLQEFMSLHGLHKVIAFSGGASTELSGVNEKDPLQEDYKKVIEAAEERVLGEALGLLKDFRIAVLTGGTKWGVPLVACKKAKEFGVKTIGVYPLAGKKHALDDSFLDLSFCVEPMVGESRWGDESSIFASILDGVIVCGGGAGTLTECAHILKINEALKKSGKSLKYLVPIGGTGGVADFLQFILADPRIRSLCMPNARVTSGLIAAEILRDKLNLEYYLSSDEAYK